MARGPNRWFFDLWSLVYDVPLVQRVTYLPGQDAVLRALRDDSLTRILDVGCGTGLLAARMARELRGRHVTGCDFSGGMLRRARGRRRPVAWVQGDALRLPFCEAAFDAVVSTEAFHWFPDQGSALVEFHRVLAPGGRLLVVASAPPVEWLSRATATGSRLLGEPLRWPTRETMRRMAEEAGFRVENQRFVFRLPGPVLFPAVLTQAVRP